MARLLIVHHTVSDATRQLLAAVLAGATDPAIDGVEVVEHPALTPDPAEVLAADGLLLGTTANFGYMSGALKHFFDTIYEPCLDLTRGRPYGLWTHGRSDTAGAITSVEKIVTGLGWIPTQPPVSSIGTPTEEDLAQAWELGATTAATLTL